MKKPWFMVPIEYSPNEKSIMAPRNVPLWFISPMEKTWFYETLLFEAVIDEKTVRDEKIQYKRYKISQDYF